MTHCDHCESHGVRLEVLETRDAIRDAFFAALRWILPILISCTAIVVAVIVR